MDLDQLENNKGYILEEANGNRITFWVIDYKLYKPVSIEPENNSKGQCQNVTLNISIPTIRYTTLSGSQQVIPRDFKISYQTLRWKDGTGWNKVDTTQNIIAPAVQRSVAAPYCDSKFSLIGDQFASDLGIPQDTVSSTNYVTSAVISHLATNVTSRQHDKNNEGSAPSGLHLWIVFHILIIFRLFVVLLAFAICVVSSTRRYGAIYARYRRPDDKVRSPS